MDDKDTAVIRNFISYYTSRGYPIPIGYVTLVVEALGTLTIEEMTTVAIT